MTSAGGLCSGCSPVEPTFSAPATLVMGGDTAEIHLPATAAIGAPFDITIDTWGGGCTQKASRTEQEMENGTIVVRPYNETYRSPNCTLDIRIIPHTVTVTPTRLGPLPIRFVGESGPELNGGPSNTVAHIDRMVNVQ